jgi:hypothetical protein
MLTALRFRALGWKPSRALIPFAIAAIGTASAMAVGVHSSASLAIAHAWRAAASMVQLGTIIRAMLAWADCDPRSAKQALLLETLAKRRALMALSKAGKPIHSEREREAAALMALHGELRRYGETHGFRPSPEMDAIRARIADQKAFLDRIRAAEAVQHEQMRVAIDELNAATKSLKEKRRAP